MSGDPDAGATSGSNGADKNCFGCHRSYLHGRSWVNTAERVTWYSGGRGNWCHDCFCAWRTVYSLDHSLPFFYEWIQSAPERRAEWEMVLVGYLSLIFEGCARVTGPMVQQRVNSLRFVFRMIGVPGACFGAVSLADIQQMGLAIDPSSVVSMRIDGVSRLGALVPSMVCAGEGPHQLRRPAGPFGVQGLPARSILASSHPDDRALLAELFLDGAADPLATELVVAEPSEVPTPHSGKKNKLEFKFETMVTIPRRLCKALASEGWEDVKESSVTSALGKLRNLYDEAASSGQRDTIEQIEDWIGGLSSLKQFIKVHRDYIKTNAKTAKLMEMLEPLAKFERFMQSMVGENLAPSVSLLLAKMRFYDEAMSGETYLGRAVWMSDKV